MLRLLEEKRRRLAKNTLLHYAQYIQIPGAPINDDENCENFYPENVIPAKHHELLLEKLQDVAEGRIKRLMILMPPGSAKSTYASVVFPTWFMGKYPNKNIIMATYGSDLAKKFGRKCRQIAKSKEYNEIFDTGLTAGNTAADDWSLTNSSTYMCGGLLSGITGNRADGFITDDPFKGRTEADSPTIRQNTQDEYIASVKTRIKPSGWEILINTRWHEDDTSGRILPPGYNGESGWITGQDGEKWYVICLQAQCERADDPLGRKIGDWLWTEWFPIEWWEQTKRTQSTPTARNWSALYQQRPAPEEGDFFKKEWIKYYDEIPERLRIYGASDYAVTEGDGDYTVHLVAGVDEYDDIYIIDLWRKQTSSDVWVEKLLDFARIHKPAIWGEESGQIIRSLDPFILKRQRERKIYFCREQFTSTADKPTRAQSIRARIAMGKVKFPKNATFMAELLTEMLTFPAGRNDDQVDCLSLLGRMLDDMQKVRVKKDEKRDMLAKPTFDDIMLARRKPREGGRNRI